MWPPEHSLITGASSGIGAALAKALAQNGRSLTLLGRSEPRLSEIASLCRASGAKVETVIGDVTDRETLKMQVTSADNRQPLDLLIANAGVSGGTQTDINRIAVTNFHGVLNSVEPVLPMMRKRKRGRIAVMASLAGFKSFPNAPVYCATKSAVRSYGEALAARLRPEGISVSVLCPGFIKTPLTDANPFSMPLIMEPDDAARKLLEGIRKRRVRVVFPKRLYWMTRFLEVMPAEWSRICLTQFASGQGLKE